MVPSELKLEKWKQKLLDLGKKNRLLNYRETKRSNLNLVEPNIDKIYKALSTSQTLEFILRDPKKDDILLLESVDNNKKDTRNIVLKTNQLITDRSDSELIKTLGQIRSKAKVAIEEQSVNILYIAFGFLNWKEVDHSNIELKSPLVLVPVSLTLDSIWENYKLNMIDDDILVNPTLLFKLDRDFGITLPSYDDYEEEEILSYLKDVHNTVASHGWKVTIEAHLSLFSFHKINMYQDLDKYSDKVLGHSLIKAFTGDKSELKLVPEELNNFDHDASTRPIDTYQVVDADSSQQDAVVATKKGISFVLQGPPGTGKSQTITNIIAECLADGKSVLFVSEKMAALEVVYKRLKEATLTDFCLQLHSRKANKRDVLTELGRTLNISRVHTRDKALALLDQLLDNRNRLNEYVKSLHTQCDPLGMSIYEIHGMLQQYQNDPDITYNLNDVENVTLLDINKYNRILSDFARTANKLGSDYQSNPWVGCNAKALTLELQHDLQTNFRRLSNTLLKFYQVSYKYSGILKLNECNNFLDITNFMNILKVSKRSTKPPISWFTSEDITPLAEQARAYLQLSNEYNELHNHLMTSYNSSFLLLSAENLTHQIKSNIEATLTKLNNSNYPNGETVFSQRESLCNDLDNITKFCEQISSISKKLTDILGINQTKNLLEVKEVIDLAALILLEPRPAATWFDNRQLSDVKKAFNDAKALHEQLAIQEKRLIDDFDKDILSINYANMLVRFRVEYKSVLKYFKSSYREDKKTIQGFRKNSSGKLKDDQILLILEQVKDITEKKAWLSDNKENLSLLLGNWYNGQQTDWLKLDTALSNFDKINDWFNHKEMPYSIHELLLKPSASLSDIRKGNEYLVNLIAGFSLQTVEKYLPLQVQVDKMTVADMQQMASAAYTFINMAILSYNQLVAHYKGDNKPGYTYVLSDLNKLARLTTIEGEIMEKSEHLKELYGYYFKGIDTDWNTIITSLAWSNEFMEAIKQYRLPTDFIDLMCLDDDSISEANTGSNILHNYYNSIEPDYNYLISLFDKNSHDFPNHDIKDLCNWLIKCIEDFSALEEWIDYSASRNNCIEVGLNDYVEKVIEARLPNKTIVGSFFKRFYRLWLDIMYQRFPAVLGFRRRNHEELINEFKQLDENQFNIARARIKERLCQRLPDLKRFTTGKDELGILQRELGKRRKIMPLRKLFQNIPNLLLTIKPCFMMSPLTVSIFLNPECYKFDVVIFDEASQICTEDAIGAIFRGSQIIIAGDSEQLPPTNFFAASTGENEFQTSEEDEDDTDAYESVLDEAKTILPEETLLWHYRSRHEHLIAFSNAKIYKNLITFPSCIDKVSDHGVEYVYIKDGVYDRSGKRDNRIEAQKVAELVFMHFEKFPHRSLGAVTFSEAQQQAVEAAVRKLRGQSPAYERFFDESREEAFFIKNLENVQGDERDTIIFSIGYSKDQNGVMHMNFGPLSKNGGYRRLNVAITRAKFNVKLVGSISPLDIDLERTGSEGVKMLRSYMEFAIKGPDILLNEIVEPEKIYTESPFEEEIYKLLVDKGYKVVTQVGCSGYRIDMAIKHPKDSGRYVLGIECDGATYHSARTARERDRLRQSVLEDRGWRIYRIWSTDWIKDPLTETQRLVNAIEDNLEACIYCDPFDLQNHNTSEDKKMSSENICIEEDQSAATMSNDNVSYYFKEYKEADVFFSERRHWESTDSYIMKVVRHVIEIEGPIYFDLLCKRMAPLFGRQKVTIAVTRTIQFAIDELKEKDIEEIDRFYKLRGSNIEVRVPASPDEARNIEHICKEEIGDAMLAILSNSYGISADYLIVETARIFGYNRMGIKIKDGIGKGLKYIIDTPLLALVRASRYSACICI